MTKGTGFFCRLPELSKLGDWMIGGCWFWRVSCRGRGCSASVWGQGHWSLSYFFMKNNFGGHFFSPLETPERLSEKKYFRFIRSFKPDAAFLLLIPKYAVSAAGKHMTSKRKDS